MSQENVERVRAAIDAYNREGPEAFFELLDPEVEWVTDRSDLGRSTFRGLHGVRKSFDELSEALSLTCGLKSASCEKRATAWLASDTCEADSVPRVSRASFHLAWC
jgi:ketosteroid isomerase-like protein